ncbi:hypothetical protein ASE28_12720 [Acidovorax sp. Root219]|nr:hypothetical protein ASE28_12720 [Acidovorax sp. Root219]
MWVVAMGASALSMGNGRGAVVIGSPVDLVFDIQPDQGSDVASSCIGATLVAGDTPISASRVRVTPQAESAGRAASVRVQTTSVVDEPVLTVTLTAGCAGKVTRSYTFLADPPARLPPVAPAQLPAVPAALPGTLAAGASGLAGASSPLDRNAAGAAARGAAAAPTRAAPASAAAARAPRAPAAAPARTNARVLAGAQASAPAAAGPRLVLEPLDLWLESPVALRATAQLLSTPAEESSPQRAEAAAAWKALNATPETLAQDAERLRVLEAEAKAVKAGSAQQLATTQQLQQQLDEAQERFPATVVYVLGALLALALGLLAWVWQRASRQATLSQKSWRESVKVSAVDSSAPTAGQVDPGWEPLETLPVPSMKGDLLAPSGSAALFKDAKTVSAPAPLYAATTAVAAAAARVPVQAKAPAPAVEPARALQIVNPDDLFDIQQQAEFFVSVGEHNQAVEVLRKHIFDHKETTPVAYLELLRLFHTLSRAEDFMQLRAQFMRYFNAKVPEFSAFNRQGRPLDRYPDALAEVEAEWSSPAVLHTLDKFLFHRPGNQAAEPFDLAAYDDLLLLLGIAQTTPSSARGAPPPRKRTTPVEDSFEAAAEKGLSHLSPLDNTQPDFPLDSLAASLEFDFGEVPSPAPAPVVRHSGPAELRLEPASGLSPIMGVSSSPAPLTSAQPRHPPATYTRSSINLDVDLSEPLHLTLSDLPPVPVTPPPPAGQAVGFGAENDLMELRLELEQRKDDDERKK